jgi:hypothetical protein
MSLEKHAARHQELHRSLDELMADWFKHSDALEPDHLGRIASQRPLKELLDWSARQIDDDGPDHAP